MSQEHALDPREFRTTLGRFATGVTVVTTEQDGAIHGMTANAFMSVSLDPPLVLVSINHLATMHNRLSETKRYGVSILSESQAALSDHFARRAVEGLELRFIEKHGVPLLEGAVAHLIAHVVDMHPAGDHTLFIGHVDYLERFEGKPLIFFGGNYHQLKTKPAERETRRQTDFSLYLLGKE